MVFPLNSDEDGDEIYKTPLKYVPLCEVYSATAPCVSTSRSSMPKKVKPRKTSNSDNQDDRKSSSGVMAAKSSETSMYSRRRHCNSSKKASVFDNLTVQSGVLGSEVEEEEEVDRKKNKKRKVVRNEITDLGVDSRGLGSQSLPLELRSNRRKIKNNCVSNGIKPRLTSNGSLAENSSQIITKCDSVRTKKWALLSYDGDSKRFIGLKCKVYWPLDDDWYYGFIIGYDSETDRHHVKYKDGEEEYLILSNERIKFFVSVKEMKRLKLRYGVHSSDTDSLDTNEVFAAGLDDCYDLDLGDVIWAKISGNAMWPAVILDESVVSCRKDLSKVSKEKPVLVQFFGTHDFARLSTKQTIPFLKGLLSTSRLECKKSNFLLSLEEAKMYLSEQKLPKRMLLLRKSKVADYEIANGEDEASATLCDEGIRDEELLRNLEDLNSCPIQIGDLQVESIGKIFKNSDCFYDSNCICPEGYIAVRKFPSVSDPSVCISYKMEVLRDADALSKPLFRVTSDDGEQFEGSTSSSCWDKIYRRISETQFHGCDVLKAYGGYKSNTKSGPDMFGFSHPEILKLLQISTTSQLPIEFSKMASRKDHDLPVGYRAVEVKWKDLDKCNVCYMDEEYENNLFLQCDKCRMMVHARCCGELEPVDGVLWLCNLCRPGAPEFPPPCCLCPVTGGAMKPTTDGRWAHLACAIWIPETCLSDIKKMEPIDGLERVNKDRWKLLCSICGVPYGACIQCSNSTCYVAYHPLCARLAGFCVELEDEDRLHPIPGDEDEETQCIRLLSFCKRHKPPSNERLIADDLIGRSTCQYTDYTPPLNPSGCARTEAYNNLSRRGRKEPEAFAAMSLKHSYVENVPYLVGGYIGHSQCDSISNLLSSQHDASRNIFSMAEKYMHMKKTCKKRLTFGKSGIHGYGVFAKQPHIAGDMVIEYTGEIVRPPIADRREHLIYNSFVGAGTYMFRIDDERVIDATKAGSVAHLINHSCEPNCYSRVITVNDDEHIIIFAKRDIKQWEELTYDYRFFSIDEQLACYCGFPRCRGVVNDIDAEQISKQYVPLSELSSNDPLCN